MKDQNFYELGKSVAFLQCLIGLKKVSVDGIAGNFDINSSIEAAYIKLAQLVKGENFEQSLPSQDVIMDNPDGTEQLLKFLNRIRLGLNDRDLDCIELGFYLEKIADIFSFIKENCEIIENVYSEIDSCMKIVEDILKKMLDRNEIAESVMKNFIIPVKSLISNREIIGHKHRIFDELRNHLKNDIFQKLVSSPKYSEINTALPVNEENWVLSLVRRPDEGSGEHAFLIIEGVENMKSRIIFIDFVIPNRTSKIRGVLGKGEIRIYDNPNNSLDAKLLYTCKLPLMDIQPKEYIRCSSWGISKEQGIFLYESVLKQKDTPPQYIAPGSGFSSQQIGEQSSTSQKRHNCFTWARENIHELKDERVQVPYKMSDWLAAAPSIYLRDTRTSFISIWQRPIVIAGIAATAAIAGGLISANAESISGMCKMQ